MSRFTKFFREKGDVWIMVGAVFLTAMVLAALAYNQSIARLHQIALDRLKAETDNVVAEIDRHYEGASTTLRSMQGFFAGSQEVTRKEFYDFIETSKFFSVFHGFSTFAYIPRVSDKNKESFISETRKDFSVKPNGYPNFSIKPAGEREEYWPILYVAPEETAERLLGIDQRAETIRRENIIRARDTGDLSISEAINLAPKNKMGIIIAAPLYESKNIPASAEDRERLFSGVVTSALYLDDFLRATISFEELEKRGITIKASGINSGEIVLVSSDFPKSFLARFYGDLSFSTNLTLGNRPVEFVFSAPAAAQLSRIEQFEPFLYVFVSIFAALFISTLILISQKFKKLADLKSRYEFISTLSHQLNTPISVLRWELENLSVNQKEKAKQKELLKAVANLGSIVQKMLVYLEITRSEKVLIKKTLSVAELYEEALKNISSRHNLKRIKLIKNGESEYLLNLDAKKVALAISYILDNALAYSDPRSKVKVEIEPKAGYAEIKISDSGYGIPEDKKGEIFEEFFRAPNALLGQNTGSGVSLFIARKIILANGGNIGFSSKENDGTVFVITLPLINKGDDVL